MKYYPWRDLYDKKLTPPFVPRLGDNFDSNYCNALDKIGNNTQEKYDRFLKEEEISPSFSEFYFYFNENEADDPYNTNQKKFYNPHTSLVNPTIEMQLNDTSKKSISQSLTMNAKNDRTKQLSNSGSAGSLYSRAMGSSFGSSTIGSSSSPASSVLK